VFGEFKKLIAPMVGLDVDEFKVSRGTIHWKIEIKKTKKSPWTKIDFLMEVNSSSKKANHLKKEKPH